MMLYGKKITAAHALILLIVMAAAYFIYRTHSSNKEYFGKSKEMIKKRFVDGKDRQVINLLRDIFKQHKKTLKDIKQVMTNGTYSRVGGGSVVVGTMSHDDDTVMEYVE